MSKYLLTKAAFIFFSVTTVIIFTLLRFDDFIGMIGSTQAAILIYSINTLLLCISVIAYALQKAKKDTSKQNDQQNK